MFGSGLGTIKFKWVCEFNHTWVAELRSVHGNKSWCPECAGQIKNNIEFIRQAISIHGPKYDYSKVIYINNRTDVIIICNKHGEFKQSPRSHLGQEAGCPICSNNIKRDTEWFIKKSIDKHGLKYNYSKSIYTGSNNKIIIICPMHGKFKQEAVKHHSAGRGCPKCAGNLRLDTDEFIRRSRTKFGNKFIYTKTNYINKCTKVIIICPEHGEFAQTPKSHLNKKSNGGCKECSGVSKIDTNVFIKKSQSIYGDNYLYSKVDYVSSHKKVIITCKIHGDFSKTPANHFSGQGCPKCGYLKNARFKRTM